MLCLIQPLNIPHSIQNQYFFSLKCSVSIKIDILATVQHTLVRSKVVMLFYNCHGDGLGSGFYDNCKLYSLFIISRLSTEIQLSIQCLLLVTGNSIKKACLGTVMHD